MKFNPVLSSSQLKRLSDHKYSCTSSSLLEPFLQPWWNWVVSQIPIWLAPNLITITGLAVNIITSLVLIYVNPDGKQEAIDLILQGCADFQLIPTSFQSESIPCYNISFYCYRPLDGLLFYVQWVFSFIKHWMPQMANKPDAPALQAHWENCLIMDVIRYQLVQSIQSLYITDQLIYHFKKLNSVFVALAACITVGLGVEPWWMFVQCFFGFTLFYCAHWQTYVSGM